MGNHLFGLGKIRKNSGPARSTELAPSFIVSLAFDVLRRGSEEHLVGFRLSELSC